MQLRTLLIALVVALVCAAPLLLAMAQGDAPDAADEQFATDAAPDADTGTSHMQRNSNHASSQTHASQNHDAPMRGGFVACLIASVCCCHTD